MFVPFLPPCVVWERGVVVHWQTRTVAVVACVGINTTIRTTDDAVIAAI